MPQIIMTKEGPIVFPYDQVKSGKLRQLLELKRLKKTNYIHNAPRIAKLEKECKFIQELHIAQIGNRSGPPTQECKADLAYWMEGMFAREKERKKAGIPAPPPGVGPKWEKATGDFDSTSSKAGGSGATSEAGKPEPVADIDIMRSFQAYQLGKDLKAAMAEREASAPADISFVRETLAGGTQTAKEEQELLKLFRSLKLVS